MPIRYVPGFGDIEFPDDMAESDQKAAIQGLYSKYGLDKLPRPEPGASDAEVGQYLELLERAGQQAVSDRAALDADLTDMGFMERRRLGVGKGAQDVFLGVQQLFADEGGQAQIQQQLADSEAAYSKLRQNEPVWAAASEIMGNAAATAPAMLIPGGQGAAANMASIGAQGALAGLAQPVVGEDVAGGKAEAAALGGALGVGIAAAPNAALAGYRGVRKALDPYQPTPTQYLAEDMQVGRLAEQAMEGAPPLTPGQLTADPGMIAVENAARQAPHSRAMLQEFDQMQTEGARQGIDSFSRRIGGINLGKAGAGTAVRRATNEHVLKLQAARKAEAGPLYNELSKATGGKPVVTASNYRQTLDDIVAEYSGVDSPEAMRIVKQAQDKIARLDESGGAFTVADAINTRSFAGRASKGNASMFDEVERGTNRDIAGRLHRALTDDLEAMGGDAALGDKFRQANQIYRDYSQSIEAVERSALGRLMGKEFEDALGVTGSDSVNTIAPERVYERLIKMPPSDIESAMTLIGRQSPQTAKDLRTTVIQSALDDAGVGSALTNQRGTVGWSGANYMRALPDADRLRALGFSKGELREMAGQLDYLRRIGDRTGTNFSNTNAQGVLGEAIEAFTSLKAWLSGKVVDAAARKSYMQGVAQAMADPEGRRAIQALSVAKSPEQVAEAMKKLPQFMLATQAESAATRMAVPAAN